MISLANLTLSWCGIASDILWQCGSPRFIIITLYLPPKVTLYQDSKSCNLWYIKIYFSNLNTSDKIQDFTESAMPRYLQGDLKKLAINFSKLLKFSNMQCQIVILPPTSRYS